MSQHQHTPIKYFVIIPDEIIPSQFVVSAFKESINTNLTKFIYASNFDPHLTQSYVTIVKSANGVIDKNKSTIKYLKESIENTPNGSGSESPVCVFILYKPPIERTISAYLKAQIPALKNNLWKEIHLTALNPDLTPEEQKEYFAKWDLRLKVTCGMCYAEWKVWLSAHRSNSPWYGPRFFKWTVYAHNAVNLILQKQTVSFKKAYEYWINFADLESVKSSDEVPLSIMLGPNFRNYRNEIQDHLNAYHKNIAQYITQKGGCAFVNIPLDYLPQIGINIFETPFNINGPNIHYGDKVVAVIGRHDKLDIFEKDVETILTQNNHLSKSVNLSSYNTNDLIIQSYYPDGLYEWMLDNVNIDISLLKDWIANTDCDESNYVDYFYSLDDTDTLKTDNIRATLGCTEIQQRHKTMIMNVLNAI